MQYVPVLHKIQCECDGEKCEKKGRRERKGRGGALSSCDGLRDTPALVVGYCCSRWSNANYQSLACTAHKVIEYGSVRTRDGENFSALTLLSRTIRRLDDCTTPRR